MGVAAVHEKHALDSSGQSRVRALKKLQKDHNYCIPSQKKNTAIWDQYVHFFFINGAKLVIS